MTTEQRIDAEILSIDPEECCCPDFRKGIQLISSGLQYGMELGHTDIFSIPKFRLCPWCGTPLNG